MNVFALAVVALVVAYLILKGRGTDFTGALRRLSRSYGLLAGLGIVALLLLTGRIGLAIAGVPFAGLLTALMLLLCIAQLGPLLVLVPAVAWMYSKGDHACRHLIARPDGGRRRAGSRPVRQSRAASPRRGAPPDL